MHLDHIQSTEITLFVEVVWFLHPVIDPWIWWIYISLPGGVSASLLMKGWYLSKLLWWSLLYKSVLAKKMNFPEFQQVVNMLRFLMNNGN